jgi:secreted PhoX family phosphatase
MDTLPKEDFYDWGHGKDPSLGGTTTVVIAADGQVEKQFLSLAGTIRNCAGGPTPWGSWVTCEETMQLKDEFHEKNHGYNFEVPARAEIGRARPEPLRDMGRFNHEAIAVDPKSGIVYQTEDRDDSLIYRYIPNEKGHLAAGGRLQALVVIDAPSLDTRNWEETLVRPGEPMAVRWIDMERVRSPKDDLRLRGFAQGAARFARGEGMWYGQEAIYFACTSGGSARKGQIWRYMPSPQEGTEREEKMPGYVELFVEPNDGAIVDNADNLTVSPWGDLVVCEDGPEQQFLVGVTPAGQLYQLARNALNKSEFAGAVFAPDGETLYVNIQNPGVTLAIQGPWQQG